MKKVIALVSVTTLFSLPVQAELFGTVDGRSADVASQSQMAIELHANQGSEDFSWQGLRFNYKVSDSLVVFADYAKSKVDKVDIGPANQVVEIGFDGNAMGGGFVLGLQDLVSGFDTSITGSYHVAKMPDTGGVTFNNQPTEIDLEMTTMSARILVSPQEALTASGMFWYASAGYSTLEGKIVGPQELELDDVAGATFGLGLVMPLSAGEVFLGYESVDGDRIAGGGFRYSF